MKYLIYILPIFVSGQGCTAKDIVGVFPKIPYFTCTDYALFIGFVGIISAYLFWNEVTK